MAVRGERPSRLTVSDDMCWASRAEFTGGYLAFAATVCMAALAWTGARAGARGAPGHTTHVPICPSMSFICHGPHPGNQSLFTIPVRPHAVDERNRTEPPQTAQSFASKCGPTPQLGPETSTRATIASSADTTAVALASQAAGLMHYHQAHQAQSSAGKMHVQAGTRKCAAGRPLSTNGPVMLCMRMASTSQHAPPQRQRAWDVRPAHNTQPPTTNSPALPRRDRRQARADRGMTRVHSTRRGSTDNCCAAGHKVHGV